MGKTRNNDLVSKELILLPRLCYNNLVSMQHIALIGMITVKRINLLVGFLVSGRDCKKHVDRELIRMSPLCDEISSSLLCWVGWVGTPQ